MRLVALCIRGAVYLYKSQVNLRKLMRKKYKSAMILHNISFLPVHRFQKSSSVLRHNVSHTADRWFAGWWVVGRDKTRKAKSLVFHVYLLMGQYKVFPKCWHWPRQVAQQASSRFSGNAWLRRTHGHCAEVEAVLCYVSVSCYAV